MNAPIRCTFAYLVVSLVSCSLILDLPPPMGDPCADADGRLNCYQKTLPRTALYSLRCRLSPPGPTQALPSWET